MGIQVQSLNNMYRFLSALTNLCKDKVNNGLWAGLHFLFSKETNYYFTHTHKITPAVYLQLSWAVVLASIILNINQYDICLLGGGGAGRSFFPSSVIQLPNLCMFQWIFCIFPPCRNATSACDSRVRKPHHSPGQDWWWEQNHGKKGQKSPCELWLILPCARGQDQLCHCQYPERLLQPIPKELPVPWSSSFSICPSPPSNSFSCCLT